jgi:outer membrane protein assembly factor BamA
MPLKLIRHFIIPIIIILISIPILGQNLNLKIVGKDSLETKIIDSLSYQKTFKDFKSLSKEVDTFLLRIQKAGFIEAELISTNKKHDSYYLSKIHLNSRFCTIYIYVPKNTFSETLLRSVSTDVSQSYFTLPISILDETLEYLNSELAKQGNPFSSIKLVNISKQDEKSLRADLSFETGESRTLDKIIVKGYEEFPERFIKHYLKLKPGINFSLEDINEKTEALANLPFARQLKTPEVLFTKDSTTVYLYLERVKSNNFDGFLGFGTNESSGRLEFDGYLNLALRNNLKSGESFYLTYKSDENEQRTFDVNLELPYLFRSVIGANINLNIFKKDSTFNTVKQNFGLFHQLDSKHRIQAEVNHVKSNALLETQTEIIEDYTSNFLNLKYSYQVLNIQNFLFPIKTRFNIDLGVGSREERSIKMNQQLYKFRASNIFFLNLKNSFFINLEGSGLFSDNYLNNELFRFGGINSIRGFEENSIPASLFGLFNSEYRLTLNNSIYIHSIIDVAYYENDIDNLKKKIFGLGFGFGILTKAGLLRMNFANGKTEDSKIKLSNSKIHLSLRTIF